jgi:hypothetical protein
VQINSEQGTFSFRYEDKRSIYIDGDGIMRHWTEKAINRGGFKVSKEKTFPFIILPAENNPHWKLVNESDIEEFSSLYDLMKCMNGMTAVSI